MTGRLSAVVLAGGRSTRFGRDKLFEPVDGRPLLRHAVDAVRPVASEVIVVVPPGGGGTDALRLAAFDDPAAVDVRLVDDAHAFEGPLAGLAVGLGAAREAVVIVVGGDMPSLVGAVLESMAAALGAPGTDVVVLEHDGRARPLPMAVRRTSGHAAALRLLDAGERRLRALTDVLPTRILPEATWRELDPDGRTIRDVDTPADLA